MAKSIIDVLFPLAGLNRQSGFQSQPPYTTVECLNTRSKDVFKERLRGGSRPGLVQVLPGKSAALAAPEAPAEPTVVTEEFYPTKDAYMDASLLNNNYGTGGTLFFGHSGSSNRWRAILHFDLSTLPSGKTITSADMTVRVATAQNTIPLASVSAYRMTTTAWVENEVTWNVASSSLDWTTNGGDFSEVTPTPDSFTWPSGTGGYTTFSVLSLVQDAYTEAGRSKQLYMLIKLPDDTNPSANLWSGFFSANNIQEYKPKITVEYEA